MKSLNDKHFKYFPGVIPSINCWWSITSSEFSRVSTNIHWFLLGIFSESVSQTVIAGNGSSWTGTPIWSMVVSTGWVSQCCQATETVQTEYTTLTRMKRIHERRSNAFFPSTTYRKPWTVVWLKYSLTFSFASSVRFLADLVPPPS